MFEYLRSGKIFLVYLLICYQILQVSIMQIASEKKVYILDLIKLYEDVPSILDECLGCLLHSSSILKLGK